ncbi:hypothetical protein K505DRAFT_73827 [Melanomma pulvis-pyrius CBS 109.77]|uniref:Uncharacterized protein n=1 Tax=Melanomma pulvis-pyrius CBS 109.77 TaxID=1314802 RepID=A0A6A6XSK0_9PLEO|nr:hypothetical protein K505DRAFT_73827 [Melanomma pulvis-pyrius CBS 109.77]
MLQSTSSALVATSRTKIPGFQRSLASRNQPAAPTPPTPAPTPVHVYAQHKKSRASAVFEPRPSLFPSPSKGWRFFNPIPLPRLSSWSRSLQSQTPSPLPALLPPTVPARSMQRVGLCPAPLSIRKSPHNLGIQTTHNVREQSNIGRKLLPRKSVRRIMTQCVYVPWLIHGDSAESNEWNAWLGSSIGHHYCRELHG